MRPPRGGGRGGGFRGGRDGGGRGRGGGGRGFGGRGGGGFRDEGPPTEVVEVSTFMHACEGDAVTKLTNEKIPFFNAPIYLQNMTQIGKVDEIFGPINESYFSIKMMEGIVATSYAAGDKFYIDPRKLLPLARFLPQPNVVNFFLCASILFRVCIFIVSWKSYYYRNFLLCLYLDIFVV
ncbi:putative H/ACA ribonucleoprotein complex subunit 1-like protein 1 isoform X2 [Arachis ipaensis]|uniref:putative H/ACA ribonucleoprotein complex subunit 1-like protein 1 isoform X2 n=1 Tax=Arachis ipaensis TaxID=130454 RepID=UPI000A2B53E5|nr:putative H/ACA ribonucleoprotein complex subunit 1-like protein 1 isoform X2 [Arachis ipaensis]XP_029149935.1 putative H/ACA ribonucleoprotein complex subunit 1-like protein 1 isoform X2 [Arachis hypogaea]